MVQSDTKFDRKLIKLFKVSLGRDEYQETDRSCMLKNLERENQVLRTSSNLLNQDRGTSDTRSNLRNQSNITQLSQLQTFNDQARQDSRLSITQLSALNQCKYQDSKCEFSHLFEMTCFSQLKLPHR